MSIRQELMQQLLPVPVQVRNGELSMVLSLDDEPARTDKFLLETGLAAAKLASEIMQPYVENIQKALKARMPQPMIVPMMTKSMMYLPTLHVFCFARAQTLMRPQYGRAGEDLVKGQAVNQD